MAGPSNSPRSTANPVALVPVEALVADFATTGVRPPRPTRLRIVATFAAIVIFALLALSDERSPQQPASLRPEVTSLPTVGSESPRQSVTRAPARARGPRASEEGAAARSREEAEASRGTDTRTGAIRLEASSCRSLEASFAPTRYARKGAAGTGCESAATPAGRHYRGTAGRAGRWRIQPRVLLTQLACADQAGARTALGAGAMTKSGGAALPIAGVSLLMLGMLGVAVIAGAATPSDSVRSDGLTLDIPPAYLAAYDAAADRFELGADGWSYLAAIGEVESDHGRSSAPGVRSGQNIHGCCAGPMQIHNGFGAGGGTWGRFKVDGDGDGRHGHLRPGRRDRDRGARTCGRPARPATGARAVFAYNHSDAYVERGPRSRGRRTGSAAASAPASRSSRAADRALARRRPGLPRRALRRRGSSPTSCCSRASYGVRLTDCFGGAAARLARRASARPRRRPRARRRRLGAHAGARDALRLDPELCANRLCRPRPVPGGSLQRLSGPRRSGAHAARRTCTSPGSTRRPRRSRRARGFAFSHESKR